MHGRRMARSQEAMASMFLGCVGTFTPSRGLSVGYGRDWMKHDGCGGGLRHGAMVNAGSGLESSV